MNDKRVPPLNARLCRGTGLLAALSAVTFLVGNVVWWVVPEWAGSAATTYSGLPIEEITLTPLVRALCLALTTACIAVLARGLWTMRTLFARFAVGEIFEPSTGMLLRRFGKTLLVYAALRPFLRTGVTLFATMNHPPDGFTQLSFGVGQFDILLALIGTLILVLGSVMADAAQMADDNRQIV
jgi:hypothetical protein